MSYVLAGVVLGFAGSAHCLAMCGPVLLAVSPIHRRSRLGTLGRMLSYHTGRSFMYGLLGAIAGYGGQQLTTAGLGRGLAVIAGAMLIVAAIGSTVGAWLEPLTRAWSTVALRASTLAVTFARRNQRAGYLALGLANGLLPCGLVYAALAVATAAGDIIHAVLFMVGFGLGTVPALLALTMSAAVVPAGVRRRLRTALPAVLAIAGIVLIARGILPVDRHVARHAASLLSHDQ